MGLVLGVTESGPAYFMIEYVLLNKYIHPSFVKKLNQDTMRCMVFVALPLDFEPDLS